MKRGITITGIIVAVLLTATGCDHFHRGINGTFDHAAMRRHYRSMDNRRPGMTGRRYHAWNGRQMYGRNRQGNMPGMRGGFGMHQGNRSGWANGPMAYADRGFGGRLMDRIPNLTDKQRKEIADLRLKQMTEMDKIREESFAKMQALREENRSAVMNLLTDDQKKSLESGRQYGGRSGTSDNK